MKSSKADPEIERKLMEKAGEAIIPQCTKCKHFRRDAKKKGTCDAFPKGIPWEIISNEHDHRKPFKGDKGIRFKRVKE